MVIKKDVDVMKDASEIVHYNNPDIPIYVRYGNLSIFPNYEALAHWHEDIELLYITKGEMTYGINDKSVKLHQNDIIFINCKQMHHGYSIDQKDCEYIVILFHPSLVSGNDYVYQKYVKPFIECMDIEYFCINKQSPIYEDFYRFMINSYDHRNEEGFEMDFIGDLYPLFKKCYFKYELLIKTPSSDSHDESFLQKKMVQYIRDHYSESLSLDDLAREFHISRNKCCELFRHYSNQTPIDYLISFRLEVAHYLLQNSKMKVSDIATHCGFNSFSYFTKRFARKYNMNPKQCRNSNKDDIMNEKE